MDLKIQHQRLYRMLGERVLDIEHFRHTTSPIFLAKDGKEYEHVDRPTNTAVVVFRDGSCFVGTAVCSEKDQYVRKVGHTIAVGRALRLAVDCTIYEYDKPDFIVDTSLRGVALRDACREVLHIYR